MKRFDCTTPRRKRSPEYLKRTEELAEKATVPMLENCMIKATGGQFEWYGIVIPSSLITTYLQRYLQRNDLLGKERACLRQPTIVDKKVVKKTWAIWEYSKQKALESYEQATETDLLPGSVGGKLTYRDFRQYQFEIIDYRQ